MSAVSKKYQPYGNRKFTSIDEYHAGFPPAVQKQLQEMRTLIQKAAPEAEEVISYNMPAFKQEKVLVFYAANKEHIGFYPTPGPIKIFKNDLAGYKTSKGAIQFPLGKKIPATLVKKIVALRVKDVAGKSKAKKSGA